MSPRGDGLCPLERGGRCLRAEGDRHAAHRRPTSTWHRFRFRDRRPAARHFRPRTNDARVTRLAPKQAQGRLGVRLTPQRAVYQCQASLQDSQQIDAVLRLIWFPVDNDMVTHMKTTVEIADPLFEEARREAETSGCTLRDLIEIGLRRELERRRQRTPFKLRDASVRG